MEIFSYIPQGFPILFRVVSLILIPMASFTLSSFQAYLQLPYLSSFSFSPSKVS